MVIVGVTIPTGLRECSTSPVWDLSISQASRTPPPAQLSNIVIVRITLYSLTSRRIHEALGRGGDGEPVTGHLRGDMDMALLSDWLRKSHGCLAPFSGVRVPTAQKLARSLAGAGLH